MICCNLWCQGIRNSKMQRYTYTLLLVKTILFGRSPIEVKLTWLRMQILGVCMYVCLLLTGRSDLLLKLVTFDSTWWYFITADLPMNLQARLYLCSSCVSWVMLIRMLLIMFVCDKLVHYLTMQNCTPKHFLYNHIASSHNVSQKIEREKKQTCADAHASRRYWPVAITYSSKTCWHHKEQFPMLPRIVQSHTIIRQISLPTCWVFGIYLHHMVY